MSWTVAAKAVLLAGFVAGLAWSTLREPPSFLSWPMFTRLACSRLELYVDDNGRWRRLNHWEHLVHFDAQIPLVRVDGFLAYLRKVHGYRVRGTVVFTDETGEHELTVRNGQLDF